jgi:hypothetical protein
VNTKEEKTVTITIEARYDEGEIDNEVHDEAVMALCKRYGVRDTDDWVDKDDPDFSKHILLNEHGTVVATWFEIDVATRAVAEELAAELTKLGLGIGFDDPDVLMDPREKDEIINWFRDIMTKAERH